MLFTSKSATVNPVSRQFRMLIATAFSLSAAKIVFGEPSGEGGIRIPHQRTPHEPAPWETADAENFRGEPLPKRFSAKAQPVPDIPVWFKIADTYQEQFPLYGRFWLPTLGLLHEWDGQELDFSDDSQKLAHPEFLREGLYFSRFLFRLDEGRRFQVSLGMEANHCFSLTLDKLAV